MHKKVIIYTVLMVLGVFGCSVWMSSCQPDACKTRAVECKNGGTCKDGDCICASGYEGDSCQFTVNMKFASHYACIKTMLINGSQVNDNDDTLIVKYATNNKFNILMYSVRDTSYERLTATVNGNYITIPEQTIEFIGYDRTYNGSGSLNNGILTLTIYSNTAPNYSAKTTYVGYKFNPL
ncbi:MAG: hypothetical protein KBF25_00905 [Chitinophagaceae bacterium]|jgi:hypothetical protein|nr:hypothetical protein [Bacteroidota bacterium]MBP9932220.1 hypothetical protein [Chitinophagaceae bacterium]